MQFIWHLVFEIGTKETSEIPQRENERPFAREMRIYEKKKKTIMKKAHFWSQLLRNDIVRLLLYSTSDAWLNCICAAFYFANDSNYHSWHIQLE